MKYTWLVLLVGLPAADHCPEQADQEGLYEILKIAQSTNLESLKRGKMAVEVFHRPGKDLPAIVFEAKVTWNGQDALWVYRLSDPGQFVTPTLLPNETWSREISRQATGYRAVIGNSAYVFDPYDGDLMIYDRTFIERSVGRYLFEVFPATNWFRCFPPYHDQVKTWSEMIGPDSPAIKPGARLTIERTADGIIRQRREGLNGGVLEIDFSEACCGNVVRFDYVAGRKDAPSHRGRYVWERLPDGPCVLRQCEVEITTPGSATEIDEVYRLVVRSIDLQADVSPRRISFAALKAYLPASTTVHDRVAGRRYRLTPQTPEEDPAFGRLVEEVRSRGFLRKGH